MINITNYETFFLLYADNELSEAEREAVLLFVKENPLLADEFTLINNTKISAERDVVFPDKNFLYVETVDELEELYSFKPNLEIQYLHKEGLYRYEKSFRIGWVKSFMAAASIIFVAGFFWMLMQEDDAVKDDTSISFNKEISKPNKLNNDVIGIESAIVSRGKKISENKNSKVLSTKIKLEAVLLEDNKNEVVGQVEVKAYDSEISIANSVAATDVVNENITDPMIQAEPIFINTVAKNEPEESQRTDYFRANLTSTKKAPFRGVIRKITRIFGKDRPESDQVKFIQVANFQLAIAQ